MGTGVRMQTRGCAEDAGDVLDRPAGAADEVVVEGTAGFVEGHARADVRQQREPGGGEVAQDVVDTGPDKIVTLARQVVVHLVGTPVATETDQGVQHREPGAGGPQARGA